MQKECPFRMLLKQAERGCIQHGCEFYVHLLGTNPQTGAQQDEWGCSFRWLPILLTENSNQTRQAAASADKVATEVAKFHATSLATMGQEALENLVTNKPSLLPSLPPEKPVNGNGPKAIPGGN